MAEPIKPALTPEQWASEVVIWSGDNLLAYRRPNDWHPTRQFAIDLCRSGSPATNPSVPTLAGLIACANDALPDDDPRKITRDRLAELREEVKANDWAGSDTALDFIAALASYLPPE